MHKHTTFLPPVSRTSRWHGGCCGVNWSVKSQRPRFNPRSAYDCLAGPKEATGLRWKIFLVCTGQQRDTEHGLLKAHRPALLPTGCDLRSITDCLSLRTSLSSSHSFLKKPGWGNRITRPPRMLQVLNDTMYLKCYIRCLAPHICSINSSYRHCC